MALTTSASGVGAASCHVTGQQKQHFFFSLLVNQLVFEPTHLKKSAQVKLDIISPKVLDWTYKKAIVKQFFSITRVVDSAPPHLGLLNGHLLQPFYGHQCGCTQHLHGSNKIRIQQFCIHKSHHTTVNMGVSKNSGTPKSSILRGFFHYKPSKSKPSILGYPYFWKHLHGSLGPPFLVAHGIPLGGVFKQRRVFGGWRYKRCGPQCPSECQENMLASSQNVTWIKTSLSKTFVEQSNSCSIVLEHVAKKKEEQQQKTWKQLQPIDIN